MSSIATADGVPVDPDDELLVAYLDGELDAQAENDLMTRLLDDQTLNQRLQRLQEGWEWLDELPDVTPDEKWVETTLELVVADVVKTQRQGSSVWSRYRWPLTILASCVAGVLVSLWVVSSIKSNEYRQQLIDLALAESLDAYLDGSDVTLMRQLVADPAWRKMIAMSREVGELPDVTPTVVADATLEERERMIASMSLEDRARLASRYERFARLGTPRRESVRKTAAAVAQQADAQSLLETMQAYAAWMENLPTELRDQIESENAKVQREAIKKAISVTQSSNRKRSRDQLDDETVERIYFVLQEILQQRLDDRELATTKHVDAVKRLAGHRNFEPYAIFGIVYSGFQRSGRGPPFGLRSLPGPGPGPGGRERPPSLRSDELEQIRAILPDYALDRMDVLSEGDSMAETFAVRSLILRSWAEETAWRKMPKNGRQESTLLDRYNELSPEERDRIDLLPPIDMIKRITRSRGRYP